MVSALLVFGIALIYVWLAPKTFSARARLSIQPESPNDAPIRLQDLPLESFKQDRYLEIQNFRGSTLFEIIAFASKPDAAASHASQRGRELEEQVRSQLKARVSLIESAEPNPRPVRPNRKAILAISGVSSLNLAVAGVICLLVGFLKNRALLAAPKMSAERTA